MLVRCHDSALVAYFRNRASAQECEDLKQQVWLELARSRPAAVEISVRAYLLGIARHILFHAFTRQRRMPAWEPLTAPLADLTTYLAWMVREPQGLLNLGALLKRLPYGVRRLLEARYIHELSTAELAAHYAVPTGTIKSRLNHARRLLYDAVQKGGQTMSCSSTSTLARNGPPLLAKTRPGANAVVGVAVASGHGPQEDVPDVPRMV